MRTPEVAHHLTVDGLVYDPHGLLGDLWAVVIWARHPPCDLTRSTPSGQFNEWHLAGTEH